MIHLVNVGRNLCVWFAIALCVCSFMSSESAGKDYNYKCFELNLNFERAIEFESEEDIVILGI